MHVCSGIWAIIGLCTGNSPVTGEFPAQRASNAENVSISVTSSWTTTHLDPTNDPWSDHVECFREIFHLLKIFRCIHSTHRSVGRKCDCMFIRVISKPNLGIDYWSASCGSAIGWAPQDFVDDKSTLVYVMAWCHQQQAIARTTTKSRGKIIGKSHHEYYCKVLSYFLHAILCPEHPMPLKTIIDRWFRHCR